MRALVTGATGFIGTHLVPRLESCVVLSRNAQKARDRLLPLQVEAYDWNPLEEPAPAAAFEGVDVVIHLAGESVGEGRWTAEKKRRIRDSRVLGTQHLVQTLHGLETRPRLLISASAVGYYGSRGDELLDESAPPQEGDLLSEVCVAWEAESQKARDLGMRVVNPRSGIVLGSGGALSQMLPPFRRGIGGRLGSGRQWMSWIHVDDLVKLLLWIIEQETLSGPVNATAPHPVTNLEFTKTLGKVLGRPTVMPVPEFMLKMVVGEFAGVLLSSQRVIPKAALDADFHFTYPELEQALRAILAPASQ